jgi:hypothetical protein
MQIGEGASFFPRPLQDHTLNGCPVCSLWFSCFDYSSLACGHTYHPFCLYKYALKSDCCLIASCKKPFDIQNIAAIGIRPQAGCIGPKKLECSINMHVVGTTPVSWRSGTNAQSLFFHCKPCLVSGWFLPCCLFEGLESREQ